MRTNAAPHPAIPVHPSQDREVAKAKEERETGRAAERERAKVAEEVAVKLEMELTQVWTVWGMVRVLFMKSGGRGRHA